MSKLYNFLNSLNNSLQGNYGESYEEDYLLRDYEKFLKKNGAYQKYKKYEKYFLEDHKGEVYKDKKAGKLVQKDKSNFNEDKVYTFYKVEDIFEWFFKERLFDIDY